VKESAYGFIRAQNAIDTRFDPPRIIGATAQNNRWSTSLDASSSCDARDLRLPAAVVIYRDYAIVVN